MSVAIVFSLLLSLTGVSGAKELDEIRAAIKAKGAKWNAAETSVSKLSAEERKMRAGTIKPALALQEQTQATPYLLSAPSGGFDWRNNGGTNYVTSVKDQGTCGSCWAFATTGALESYILINVRPSETGLDSSEQILISCGRAGSCSGGYVDLASNFIRDTGLPPESAYNYTGTNGSCPSGWQSEADKILQWKWVATTSPSVAAIKDALYTYGPLATTMDVYTDFFYYKSGVYGYSYGKLEGGHAILIIGYQDDTTMTNYGGGYFIVKNSWGTVGWGEGFGEETGGYFRIAYSEVKGVSRFGDYTIAYDKTPPPCSYSISPKSKSFTTKGGSGSFTITAGGTCTWGAASDLIWLTTSANSRTGSGTVSYKVQANIGSARTGYINITTASGTVATFTVTQKGR